MKIYSDGYCLDKNPSPYGGGYNVTDEHNVLLIHERIMKEGWTNNEAELRGIVKALDLARKGDTVSSDSRICINWVLEGEAGSRNDLNEIARKGNRLLMEKSITLIWESREHNLAGKYNEQFEGWLKRYNALVGAEPCQHQFWKDRIPPECLNCGKVEVLQVDYASEPVTKCNQLQTPKNLR